MMMTESKQITNIQDLQLERAKLRGKIDGLEKDLKNHYTDISDKVKSVTRIFGVVSKVKNMIGFGDKEEEPDNDEPRSYLNTAVKVALPLVAGGFVIARGKKMIFKSLLGYGLSQVTKYIISKNVDEHVTSVKGIFAHKPVKKEDKGIF